jgi:hypothetical protein
LQAVEQVAFADRILLNKVDLVSAEEKAAVIKCLKVGGPPGATGTSRVGIGQRGLRGVERGGWVLPHTPSIPIIKLYKPSRHRHHHLR